MAEPVVLAEVISVRGHPIRLTLQQWLHISENHDYMAGNRSLVLEIIADPDKLLVGEASETLALRAYTQTRCLFHKYTASRQRRGNPCGCPRLGRHEACPYWHRTYEMDI